MASAYISLPFFFASLSFKKTAFTASWSSTAVPWMHRFGAVLSLAVSCICLSTGAPARRTAWPAPCRPWQLTLPPNTVAITSQLVHVGSSLVCNPRVMRSVLPLSCAHLPSSCQPSANSSNTGLSQNTCNFEPLCPVDFSLSIQIKCAWGSTLGINAGNRAPWAAFGLLGLRVAGAH